MSSWQWGPHDGLPVLRRRGRETRDLGLFVCFSLCYVRTRGKVTAYKQGRGTESATKSATPWPWASQSLEDRTTCLWGFVRAAPADQDASLLITKHELLWYELFRGTCVFSPQAEVTTFNLLNTFIAGCWEQLSIPLSQFHSLVYHFVEDICVCVCVCMPCTSFLYILHWSGKVSKHFLSFLAVFKSAW